jgi:hypothetical protein
MINHYNALFVMAVWSCSNVWLDRNIPGESLESLPAFLLNGDSDVPRLAGFDIVNRSGFAGVCAANDTAKSAVFYFICQWHVVYSSFDSFRCRILRCFQHGALRW